MKTMHVTRISKLLFLCFLLAFNYYVGDPQSGRGPISSSLGVRRRFSSSSSSSSSSVPISTSTPASARPPHPHQEEYQPFQPPSPEVLAGNPVPCGPFPFNSKRPSPDRVLPQLTSFSPTNASLQWTDPALHIYQDVAVAEDALCARLTRALGRVAGEVGDNEHAVLATHLDPSRLPHLASLAARWGGCLSVGVWVCSQEDWGRVEAARATFPHLATHVTFHAVVGVRSGVGVVYPNAARTAPLAPFSPWAAAFPYPAPWVLVVDADGYPSVGERVMVGWLGKAEAGTLAPPQAPPSWGKAAARIRTGIPGAPPLPQDFPPSLEFLAYNNTLHLTFPSATASGMHPSLLPSPKMCRAWGGGHTPWPLQCSPIGMPSARNWLFFNASTTWAHCVSRCPTPPPPKTLFILPSFDIQYFPIPSGANLSSPEAYYNGWLASRDWNDVLRNFTVGRLLQIPPTDPPLHAFLLLAAQRHREGDSPREGHCTSACNDIVGVQAGEFPPAYSGIAPWTAWENGFSGPLPFPYTFALEPYFAARAPLPSATLPPHWAVFDESYRNTWFDKASLPLERVASGQYAMKLLPHVYWLNDHALGSEDTAPRGEISKERKDASFRRLVAQQHRLGLHCSDLCPCIPPDLVEVMPPQGFHIDTEEYPPFDMEVEGCEAFEEGGPRWNVHLSPTS